MKDFSLHEVFEPFVQTLVNARQVDKQCKALHRCGVYFDLSSFMYGKILKSLEHTRQYKRLLMSLENEDKVKTVVCELDSESIEKIVHECKEMLVESLMPIFLKAYRIYFAYDNFSPLAKSFEQSRRKKKTRFILSPVSRQTCFNNLIKAVRDAVIQAHAENLKAYVKMFGLTNDCDKSLWQNVLDRAIELQLPSHTTPFSANAPFTVGEGEWKCIYRIHQDISNDAMDKCLIFGRDWDIGFAITMYQHPRSPQGIEYVYGPTDKLQHNKLFDEKERMLHFICLCLFGNDYVNGLIHLSEANVMLIKREFENLYEGNVGFCTLRHVKELSQLFTTDDLTEAEEEEESDSDQRMQISLAFATVVTRMLMAVYRTGNNTNMLPDKVEDVLYYAGIDASAHSQKPNENSLVLRQHLAQQRQMSEKEQEKYGENYGITEKGLPSKGYSDENTLLICKDSQNKQWYRTLQQCIDSFALGMLWYLSYSMFYFRSPTGRKNMWMARQYDDLPMFVGLSMGRDNTFRYNDRRLAKRYDIHRLLEFKRTLQTVNTCNLYWIVEGAFFNALNMKYM